MGKKHTYPLTEAVLLIADEKYGYIDDLVEKLKEDGFAENDDEALKLIENLALMGYLSYGIDNEYKGTWKATQLAEGERKYKIFLNNFIS